jgi:DNA-directed RNA polymerase subunit RPC12/RpoP
MIAGATETCSHCGSTFPTDAHRAYAPPLHVLTGIESYRGAEGQIRHDSRVKCPQCGHTFESPNFRFFGLFSARGMLYTILAALCLTAIVLWFLALRE